MELIALFIVHLKILITGLKMIDIIIKFLSVKAYSYFNIVK